MDWMIKNWEWVLIGFMIAEKIVKLSPTRYDDIVLDVIWNNLKKIVKK